MHLPGQPGQSWGIKPELGELCKGWGATYYGSPGWQGSARSGRTSGSMVQTQIQRMNGKRNSSGSVRAHTYSFDTAVRNPFLHSESLAIETKPM